MTKYVLFLVGSLGKRSRSLTPLLAQRFFETLQYCDEGRKFTSVSQVASESYSDNVNSGSGYDYEHVA